MNKKLRTKVIDHAHIYFEDTQEPSIIGYGKTGLIKNVKKLGNGAKNSWCF